MISFKLYLFYVQTRVFLMINHKKIKKFVKAAFKRSCKCPYTILPGVFEITCRKCMGVQKHSRWK